MYNKKKSSRLLPFSKKAVLAITTLCFAFTSQSVFAIKTAHRSIEHAPGEVIFKLRGEADFTEQSAVFSDLAKILGLNEVLSINAFQTDKSLQKIKIAHDSKLKEAINALKNNPKVEFAEPNYLVYALEDGTPNDPDFGKLWGLKNTGQTDSKGQVGVAGSDINVFPLWQKGFTGSKNVIVAIIDTGIDWTHPDLAANLYTNPGEIPDNGIDDDHNGFIDDVHGWNFNAKNNKSMDDHDHGSHCAGTIGGVGNNGIGVAGVNWNVNLMPVKFLDANGSGTNEAAIEAINYATLMKVNVMSNSWGGGAFSQAMFDSITAAKNKGILFVAAAGNDSGNNDQTQSYPASYDVSNVVSVAATDNQDKIATFSNYGSTSVHVAAPGVNVYSTTKGGKYNTFSGTSMATPHVAGIAALLLSANPDWTFAKIKDRLISTSNPTRGLSKKVVAHGRVNAYNAMYGIIPPALPVPDESKWKDNATVEESTHPYKNDEDKKYPLTVAGAKYIRVVFEKVDVEKNFDRVTVETKTGETVEDLTGKFDNYTTDYIEGDTVVIHLKSDSSVVGYGFKVAKLQVIMNSTNEAAEVAAN